MGPGLRASRTDQDPTATPAPPQGLGEAYAQDSLGYAEYHLGHLADAAAFYPRALPLTTIIVTFRPGRDCGLRGALRERRAVGTWDCS